MRRTIVATLITLSIVLAACSPYMLDAADGQAAAPTTTTAPPACDQACIYRYAHAVETARIHRTYAYAAAVERARVARIYAFAAAIERARVEASRYRPGQCGGALPPCWVMMRESRGNIHAQNPRSTASGKWQFLDSTWGRHRGYAKARYAPEWVQDERARHLWAGGRGCSHWSACR